LNLTNRTKLFVNFKWAKLELKKWFVLNSSRVISYRVESNSYEFDSIRLISSSSYGVFIGGLIWFEIRVYLKWLLRVTRKCLLIWLLTIVKSMKPFILWFDVFKRFFSQTDILKLFTFVGRWYMCWLSSEF